MGKENAIKIKECQCALSKSGTLKSALRHIRTASLCHEVYRHYTTLDALLGMIKGGSMWLTLGKSAKLDDSQEREKFGSSECWRRTYLASFVHDVEESAAMWGLYCKGSKTAVCLSFPLNAVKKWTKVLHKIAKNGNGVLVNPQKGNEAIQKPIDEVEVVDIAYADVARQGYSDRERRNFIAWCDERSHKIASLKSDVASSEVTGMLKDYEWNFEHETRVLARLKMAVPHASRIALPLHDMMLKNMTITFGPWLVRKNKQKFEEKIEEAMNARRIYDHIRTFESNLTGALRQWGC